MAKDKVEAAPEHEMTGVNSHIATQRGYAARRIIEPGEFVPHGIAVAEEWMAENPEYDPNAAEATSAEEPSE